MTVTQHTHDTEYQHLVPLFHELVDRSSSETHRRQVRTQLINEHLPVAEHIAARFRRRGQPEEDLRQVAAVGLINAVDRFDPERGSDFLSFAVPTITGEVRRYFRDATWSVHVPRRLKEAHAAITAATRDLTQRLGRSPRPSELAAELDMPIEDVYRGLQVRYAYLSESLDENPDGDGFRQGEAQLGVQDHDLATVENRMALYPALARLPEREASIVLMRFFGHLTQTQIAERVGISQMHVSRLLAASLRTMREVLQGDSAATD